MISVLLVGAGLFVGDVGSSTTPADVTSAYQAAKTQAGRDPKAHIQLALWCEAHGMSAERLKHLAIAVLADPKNATARGLMGLVAYQGQWRRPDVVSARVKSDEALRAALAEYNARRARTPDTADAHWKLGLWCEENGLKAEAMAHFTAVTRLDPGRDAAWKRLECKKQGNRWVTEAQLAAEKAEAEAQKNSDRHWQPLLTKWRGWLGEKKKRADAEKALAQVTDPRAVPSITTVLIAGSASYHPAAVRLLGQIDGPGASRALAFLAVASQSAEARREAIETLKRRDARDYLTLIISLVRKPMKYEVKPAGGPGSTGVLFVDGERYKVERLYQQLPLPTMAVAYLQYPWLMQAWAGSGIGFYQQDFFNTPNVVVSPPAQQFASNSSALPPAVANLLRTTQGPAAGRGLIPGAGALSGSSNLDPMAGLLLTRELILSQNLAQAQMAAVATQQQMTQEIASVESANEIINDTNARALAVLAPITGQDFGGDAQAWKQWWANQQGYAYQPPPDQMKPTIIQTAQLDFVAEYFPFMVRHSCFGASTLVRTLEGLRPIESLRIGDEILTQSPTSGALGFEPVLAVFHNKPAPTLRIKIGGDTIVATGIHRFWKAGKGWVMARELKAGDAIRLVEGTARVELVEHDRVQPVFNLEVASGQSFFVGQRGLLVHDNSLVQPVAEPFDAVPTIATAKEGK